MSKNRTLPKFQRRCFQESFNSPLEITVDLESQEVRYAAVTLRFEIDNYTRWRLMEGLDDIGLTLRHTADIDDFESRRPEFKPATLPAKV